MPISLQAFMLTNAPSAVAQGSMHIQGGGTSASCLLYTSDAADERSSVDLGGRRIIKKKHPRATRDRRVNRVQQQTAAVSRK